MKLPNQSRLKSRERKGASGTRSFSDCGSAVLDFEELDSILLHESYTIPDSSKGVYIRFLRLLWEQGYPATQPVSLARTFAPQHFITLHRNFRLLYRSRWRNQGCSEKNELEQSTCRFLPLFFGKRRCGFSNIGPQCGGSNRIVRCCEWPSRWATLPADKCVGACPDNQQPN